MLLPHICINWHGGCTFEPVLRQSVEPRLEFPRPSLVFRGCFQLPKHQQMKTAYASLLRALHGLLAILAISASVSSTQAQTVTTVDLNSVDASPGAVNAAPLLATYGISLSSPDGGGLGIDSDLLFYGLPGIVYASPGPNFLQMTGGTTQTVILDFSTPLTSVSFTRVEETGGPLSGNSFGAWSAEVYSGATEIGSASNGPTFLFGSGEVDPAEVYTFTGTDITSLEFDGNDYGFLGTQGILMDDLTLTTPSSSVPECASTVAMVGMAAVGLALLRRKTKPV